MPGSIPEPNPGYSRKERNVGCHMEGWGHQIHFVKHRLKIQELLTVIPLIYDKGKARYPIFLDSDLCLTRNRSFQIRSTRRRLLLKLQKCTFVDKSRWWRDRKLFTISSKENLFKLYYFFRIWCDMNFWNLYQRYKKLCLKGNKMSHGRFFEKCPKNVTYYLNTTLVSVSEKVDYLFSYVLLVYLSI